MDIGWLSSIVSYIGQLSSSVSCICWLSLVVSLFCLGGGGWRYQTQPRSWCELVSNLLFRVLE